MEESNEERSVSVSSDAGSEYGDQGLAEGKVPPASTVRRVIRAAVMASPDAASWKPAYPLGDVDDWIEVFGWDKEVVFYGAASQFVEEIRQEMQERPDPHT